MGKYVMVGCCIDSYPEDWPTVKVEKVRREDPDGDGGYFVVETCGSLQEAQIRAVGVARDWFEADIALFTDVGDMGMAREWAARMPETLARIAGMEPGDVIEPVTSFNVRTGDWVRIEASDA